MIWRLKPLGGVTAVQTHALVARRKPARERVEALVRVDELVRRRRRRYYSSC